MVTAHVTVEENGACLDEREGTALKAAVGCGVFRRT